MLKKINMIIISFFLILTLKGGYLFCLYLPVVLFYLFQDRKNMYYIYPASLTCILIFMKEYLIIYLVLIFSITLLIIFLKSKLKNNSKIIKYPTIICATFIFLVNTISLFLYPKTPLDLYLKIIFLFLSILIYLFLDIYLNKPLKDIKALKEKLFENDHSIKNTYIYLEILIAVLTCYASSYITFLNVNLSIVVGSYFAMYLSRKYQNIYGLLFSLIIVVIEFFFLNIKESIIIITLAGIYSIRSIYTIGILNIYLIILILSNDSTKATYIIIMLLSIIFEIMAHFLIRTPMKQGDEYKEMHQRAQKNVNDEILKFTSFLDHFVVGFQNPKGFNEKLSSGIKTIVDKHCNSCHNQKNCFKQNKSSLFNIFKNVLTLQIDTIKESNFPHECPKYQSLVNTSKLLNEKINYTSQNLEKKDANNYILLAQINGVSNALKNYVVDTTSKVELNYQNLYLAKDYLLNLEYYLTYYEVIRSYENDFLIKIGIKNVRFEEVKPIINTIFETILNCDVSVELIKEENTTLYIHVMPKLIIDVTYAYGNMPADTQVISGDNYLVKEQDNGHILFAISDGMGKGYSAFYESDMTLKLVDDIVKLNIDPATSLEILNTFYTVQDYLERYATLDLLDINRHLATATFYKMAANTTYIFKQNGKIDKIINKSLPLGIEEEVDQITYELENGDLIIMSSDGILENLIDNNKLEAFISETKNLLPQQIVYEILNYTSTHDIKVKDDMTIIVLKIHKK